MGSSPQIPDIEQSIGHGRYESHKVFRPANCSSGLHIRLHGISGVGIKSAFFSGLNLWSFHFFASMLSLSLN